MGAAVLVGTQLNAVDLGKRHKYAYVSHVTIKSNRMSCYGSRGARGMSLSTPSAAAAIPLEAAAMLGNDVRCVGVDVSQKAVDGAIDNARRKCPRDVCRFVRCDVRIIR